MGDSSLFSSSSFASSFLGSSETESGLSDSALSLPCPTWRGSYDRKASPRFFCELVSGVEPAGIRIRRHHRHHFLDACFLCKRPIRCVSDVFMYGGDTPFCSEECRQEQMEMDVALQRCRELESSMKPAPPSSSSAAATVMPMMSRKPSISSIPTKPHNIHRPVGATAVAS